MRKGFTLVEIVISLVVVLVLVMSAIIGYRQLLDNSRQRVCQTNLAALAGAVEVYALEHDAVPATLGELETEHLRRGYARAIGRHDLFTRAAYAVISFDRALRNAAGTPPAYAAFPFLSPQALEQYGAEIEMFICPADDNGPPSYGINTAVAGKKWQDIPEDTPLVGDCDAVTFSHSSELAARHLTKAGFAHIAQSICKAKTPVKTELPPPAQWGQQAKDAGMKVKQYKEWYENQTGGK